MKRHIELFEIYDWNKHIKNLAQGKNHLPVPKKEDGKLNFDHINWTRLNTNSIVSILQEIGFTFEYHSNLRNINDPSTTIFVQFNLGQDKVDLTNSAIKIKNKDTIYSYGIKGSGKLYKWFYANMPSDLDQIQIPNNKWNNDLIIRGFKIILGDIPNMLRKLNKINIKVNLKEDSHYYNMQVDNFTSNQINNLW